MACDQGISLSEDRVAADSLLVVSRGARYLDPLPTPSVVGSREGGADRGEGRVELRSDRRDGGDDHDRDERGDESVFDGCRAGFVPEERKNAGQGGFEIVDFMVGVSCFGLRPSVAGNMHEHRLQER